VTYQQVIAYYGTQEKLAAALGITQPVVSLWHKRVPPAYQYQLEVVTAGALKVEDYLRRPRQAA
jgi:DNA-binding transcriptional regulator YdaS (Cro superfamily)